MPDALTDELDPIPFLNALGAPTDARPVPLTGGTDTALWRVSWPRFGRQDAVLRVLRPEQAPVLEREIAAIYAAATAGIPVPAVVGRGIVQGRPALLLSYVEGVTAMERITAMPERGEEVGQLLGRALAALHAWVPAPGLLAGEPDRWIALAGADTESLQARLRTLPRRNDALLHLDFHPSNVVLTPQGDSVAAILDWTNCRAGDPRADVARTLVLLDAAPAPPGTLPVGREESLRAALVRAFRDGYESLAGPLPPAAEMAPFFAWAAAWTLADLTPRTGPGGPLRPEQLDPLRRLYAYWRGA